jgi:hypothetical protein
MINANDNSHFMRRIQNNIARMWNWPEHGRTPEVAGGGHVTKELLARYAGYYEIRENNMIPLVPNKDGTGLETLVDGLPDENYLPLDSVRFRSSEEGMSFTLNLDSLGLPTGVRVRLGDQAQELWVARVAPLPSAHESSADPDQGLTEKITAALHAIQQRGQALAAAPNIFPGLKRDLAGWNGRDLDGMGALTYLGVEDVSGRSIHRHGAEVARVRFYRVITSAGLRYLLIHLAPDGSVADFDVVQN